MVESGAPTRVLRHFREVVTIQDLMHTRWVCWNCEGKVNPDVVQCPHCAFVFTEEKDGQD